MKNTQTSEFGKGTRLSYYNALSFLGTGEAKIVNSLDDEDTYNVNSTFNDETELRFNNSSLRLEDEKGNLYVFIRNDTERYYYIRDALGNILGIINQNGEIVVKYSYTSYGKVTVSYDSTSFDLGNINPFRYKGYYYDVETNLYYLLSRYYDPSSGRFISPDSVDYLESTNINGLNLYSYCGNNPVNRFDPSGHSWKWSNFW